MYVTKRDGLTEEFNISKIIKVAEFAVEYLDNTVYTPIKLVEKAMEQFKDGISTKNIHNAMTRSTSEMTSIAEPEWQYAAGKLLIYDSYKEAAINRDYIGYFGYGDFYELIKGLSEKGQFTKERKAQYNKLILEKYTEEEIRELGEYIKPERDYIYTFMGLKHVLDRYVIKGYNKEILELPQEMYMGIAMHLNINEKYKMDHAKKLYDVLSQSKATMATPTMSNARKVFNQLSSCFIDTVPDDLERIYESFKSFARVSKHGGGFGKYYGKVRSLSSEIRGVKGASGGVIPWIKGDNNTAVSVDQLGTRNGSTTIWLDVWHKDIMDFLAIKTNSGDDRKKAHDIFPGICYPDLFWQLVEYEMDKKKVLGEDYIWETTWYAFCPSEVEKVMGYRIEDCWGKEWEEKYYDCIENPILSRNEIPLLEIVRAILTSAFETGTPFTFFRDTANRMNPNNHSGMIYCSNLCTEIFQNMSGSELISEEIVEENGQTIIVSKVRAGDFVVCNLSSTVLSRNLDLVDLENTISAQMRAMDNVIDLNYYPTPYAEVTNKNYRAVGLGSSGYHHALTLLEIPWESPKHIEFADYYYAWMSFFAIKTSMELSIEKGPYKYFKGSDWNTGTYFDKRYTKEDSGRMTSFGPMPNWEWLKDMVMVNGMRNGWVFAIAPTGSTSVIAGTSAGIDPIFQKFWMEEKKGATIPQTAPDLSPKTMWIYKDAHNCNQFQSIKACGVRQKHIDQGQSFNLYVKPDIDIRDFCNMFIEANKQGLKSIYYVRNQSAEEAEACESCSA